MLPGIDDTPVSSLAFSPNDRSLLVGHLDGSVRVHRREDSGSWTLDPSGSADLDGPVADLAFNGDGHPVACVSTQDLGLRSSESSAPLPIPPSLIDLVTGDRFVLPVEPGERDRPLWHRPRGADGRRRNGSPCR